MKEAFLSILAAAVLSMSATSTFSAAPAAGRGFIDADGNGVCDNECVCVYADEDGDGLCDNCGAQREHAVTGAGHGGNFVDVDGNGVCDNYVSGQSLGGGHGHGSHHGHHG